MQRGEWRGTRGRVNISRIHEYSRGAHVVCREQIQFHGSHLAKVRCFSVVCPFYHFILSDVKCCPRDGASRIKRAASQR